MQSRAEEPDRDEIASLRSQRPRREQRFTLVEIWFKRGNAFPAEAGIHVGQGQASPVW
jgi:hypothetical protein